MSAAVATLRRNGRGRGTIARATLFPSLRLGVSACDRRRGAPEIGFRSLTYRWRVE